MGGPTRIMSTALVMAFSSGMGRLTLSLLYSTASSSGTCTPHVLCTMLQLGEGGGGRGGAAGKPLTFIHCRQSAAVCGMTKRELPILGAT